MAWEEKMNGVKLFDKKVEISYGTVVRVELWKYVCPKCKQEKISLFINDIVQYGGSSCHRLKNGEETFSCGCNDFGNDFGNLLKEE